MTFHTTSSIIIFNNQIIISNEKFAIIIGIAVILTMSSQNKRAEQGSVIIEESIIPYGISSTV